MAIDAQKALQLSALLAMTAQQFSVNNPGQQQLAQNLLGSAQAGIQAEALKKAKKEQEKKEKGLFGSKVGSLLGSAALAAIPGVGPVASAALGAAGGMAGGAIGGAIGGASPSAQETLANGLMGGMQGYQYGKSSQFAQPENASAERPLADTLASRSTLPPATLMGSNPAGMYPPQVQSTPLQAPAPMTPQTPPTLGSSTAATIQDAKPVGFGGRFLRNVGQTLGIEPRRKVTRNPDGSVDYWD